LLASVVTDPVYTVVIDAEVTEFGGIWAANRYTHNGQSLVYFAPGYSPQVVYSTTDGFPSSDMLVTLLTGDILWVGFNGLGLYALDTRGTPEIKGDDDLEVFRVEDTGLPSDVITALLEDKSGQIWVGTPGGLARFSPEFFPFITPLDYTDLGAASTSVLALASDLRNNIWVGTEHGLARIPSGSLTADSVWFAGATPLPDNRVYGLAADVETNALWIGTDNGLARFTLGAGSAAEQPAEPAVYPNPFYIRSDMDSVTIAVPFGAHVDIFSIAGDRVRSLNATNRWDGRNESGEPVASGLYVFRVTYPDGSTGRGRIGVVRFR
jgi:ligand-binding sensor domain-containing protein